MSDDSALVASGSQTVGPFFHFALTADAAFGVVKPLGPGERIRLVVRVTDGDARPVSDAIVELWQAIAGDHRAAFGRLPTDADGSCEFETVRPPRHINVCLFARGLLRQVHTRIYFADDPELESDPALRLVPADRRATLIATPDGAVPNRWRFDLRLQGAGETVFFSL